MKMSFEKKVKRFDEKYKDKGGYAKFVELIENFATLDEIGKHFGFSRQNAAGLYKSFFNRGYSEVHRKRRIKKQMELMSECCDLDKIQKELERIGKHRSAKKVGYIKIVKKIAESLGYDVKIRRKRSGALEVFINGHKCTVSGSNTQTIYHIPQNHPPSVYYRYAIPSQKTDFCIFVLELEDHHTIYIIPYEKIKHRTLIKLKESYEKVKGRRGNTSSKYAIYRNNWKILREPNKNPIYEREMKELQKEME